MNREKSIEEIAGQVQCPKGFECVKSEFEKLCKARDIHLSDYVECLEDNPADCTLSISFGYSHYCHCALRVHLCKKLSLEYLPIR